MKDIEALYKVDRMLWDFYFETMKKDDAGERIIPVDVMCKIIEIRGCIREHMTVGTDLP